MPKIAEQTRAARREQIIAAGLACFARSGYHAATMADVAAQAGVSKGTPYLYFDSKRRCSSRCTRNGTAAPGGGSTQRSPHCPKGIAGRRGEVLHAVAARDRRARVAEPQTCRVLMEARALAAHEPAIAAAVLASDARTHQQLEGLIAAGVGAGEWPPETDPALAARLFTAGLYGLMAQWHLRPARSPGTTPRPPWPGTAAAGGDGGSAAALPGPDQPPAVPVA